MVAPIYLDYCLSEWQVKVGYYKLFGSTQYAALFFVFDSVSGKQFGGSNLGFSSL